MAGGNVPANLRGDFVAAGHANNIPPEILAGIADVETSLGANRATSSTGAQGLMQFEPATASSLGVNPYNDRSAIFGAAKLLNQYGYQKDPAGAIRRYNGSGPATYTYERDVQTSAARVKSQLGGAASTGPVPGAPAAAAAASSSSSGGLDGIVGDLTRALIYAVFLAIGAALMWLGATKAMAPRVPA